MLNKYTSNFIYLKPRIFSGNSNGARHDGPVNTSVRTRTAPYEQYDNWLLERISLDRCQCADVRYGSQSVPCNRHRFLTPRNNPKETKRKRMQRLMKIPRSFRLTPMKTTLTQLTCYHSTNKNRAADLHVKYQDADAPNP